jgi:hypothetical protein
MNLWITEDAMTSDGTRHQARLVETGWELSWLPGRVLDRNQAVTGMVLAETVAGASEVEASRLPLISSLASELGLTGQQAVAQASSWEGPAADADGLDLRPGQEADHIASYDTAEADDVCEDGS